MCKRHTKMATLKVNLTLSNNYKKIARAFMGSIYPPDYMRSRLYEPYHKKDITALRIDKLMFNEDGITGLYPIY